MDHALRRKYGFQLRSPGVTERRVAGEAERAAWKEVKEESRHGWRAVKRRVNTFLTMIAGAAVGSLGYLAIAGYAPWVSAQTPIDIKPGGAEKILWGLICFICVTAFTLLKAWVNGKSLEIEAQRKAISHLETELAELKGELKGEGRVRRR